MTLSAASPDKLAAWAKKQQDLLQKDPRDAQKGRLLMGYLLLDLILRALALGACLASWTQFGMTPFAGLIAMLLACAYMIAGVALFPARTESVGYTALSLNPFVGAILLLYASPASPAVALILCCPTYAVAECLASTGLSIALVLSHMPGLLSLFRPPDMPWQEDTYDFGDAAADAAFIFAVLGVCAVGKLAIAYFSFWPTFRSGGHTAYLDKVGPVEWSAYVDGVPPSPYMPNDATAGSPSLTPFGSAAPAADAHVRQMGLTVNGYARQVDDEDDERPPSHRHQRHLDEMQPPAAGDLEAAAAYHSLVSAPAAPPAAAPPISIPPPAPSAPASNPFAHAAAFAAPATMVAGGSSARAAAVATAAAAAAQEEEEEPIADYEDGEEGANGQGLYDVDPYTQTLYEAAGGTAGPRHDGAQEQQEEGEEYEEYEGDGEEYYDEEYEGEEYEEYEEYEEDEDRGSYKA